MKGHIIVSASAELIESVLRTGCVVDQCFVTVGLPDDAVLVGARFDANSCEVELMFETATVPGGDLKRVSPAYQRPASEDCALCGGFHRRACEGNQ